MHFIWCWIPVCLLEQAAKSFTIKHMKAMAMGNTSFCASFIIVSVLDVVKHFESCSLYRSTSPAQMWLG